MRNDRSLFSWRDTLGWMSAEIREIVEGTDYALNSLQRNGIMYAKNFPLCQFFRYSGRENALWAHFGSHKNFRCREISICEENSLLIDSINISKRS